MDIVIGTKNQKKIKVVENIFKTVLKIESINVTAHDADSKVPEAPHDRETYEGALNRARECQTIAEADYYVGIESGLVERYDQFFEEAWAVIISKDGVIQIGYSSGLLIPPVVVERMRQGEKHNDIMHDFDVLFNLPDDNRDTWSRYTGGNISREISLSEALRNALIQSVESERNLYIR
ncbi:MAG: inosine/xanthosine triphosphatase [Candidatus Microsaccharimonas sp.]